MSKKFKDVLKSGIAGLLIGTTIATGTACATKKTNINKNHSEDIKISDVVDERRANLTELINKTFSDYVTVEGKTAGETKKLTDGTEVTRRIGCVSAPNGDNITWLGKEYISLYLGGKVFFEKDTGLEETEPYVNFKDSLISIVNDNMHTINILEDGSYRIDDKDSNIYLLYIKNGKIVQIEDTYTDVDTGKSIITNMFISKTTKAEFDSRLEEASKMISHNNNALIQ